MAGIFYIEKDSVWVDISNYVSLDKIPFIYMNRDWTPIVEILKPTVSDDCPVTPVKGDKIKIEYNSGPVFAGFIKKRKYNFDTLSYTLEINNDLFKLQEKKADRYSLANITENGGDLFKYNPDEVASYPYFGYHWATVNVLWLAKCMFSFVGLTLDTSDVEETVLTEDFYGEGVHLKAKHICLDQNALLAANQMVAANFDKIYDNYFNDIPTLYDIFVDILSAFGFGIRLIDVNSYKLITSTANYAIVQNDTENYEEEDIEEEYPVGSWKFQVYGMYENIDLVLGPIFSRGQYYAYVETMLPVSPPLQQYGSGANLISGISNLIYLTYYLYGTEIVPYGGGQWKPWYTGSVYDQPHPYRNRIVAKTKPYVKQTFTMPADTTPRTVIKNFIDPETDKSEIEQEVINLE